MVRITFGKTRFRPIFDAFLVPKRPIFKAFWDFHGPKHVTTGSKQAKNTCWSIPNGLGTTLEKMIVFAPGSLVDPPLAPTVRGPGCPAAPPSDHLFGGLGVSLGDSEAWKPQKVGDCRWNRCPRNLVLSHVAQDTARSWFWPCWTQITHNWAIFGHFWAISWTYRGARGQERALVHGAMVAHVKCGNRLPSFCRFAVLPHSYPLVPQPKRNLTFRYPWNNKAHKRQNTAGNYSSLLYQTRQPLVATLAS